MGQRRDRMDKRLARQKATRQRNSGKKEASRQRRDQHMLALLKQSPKGPYTTAVLSWMGEKLGKKSSRVSAEDVKVLLA